MKIWFVLNEGQVNGPFDNNEVDSQLPQCKSPLIWGRGMPEWLTPDKWKVFLQNSAPALVKSNNEAGLNWRVRIDGKELPPISYENMIQQLKTLRDLSAVDLKTDGFNSWKDIYSVQRVIDDLGVSRRAHPRVPIMGNVQCHKDSGEFQARAISISEGGLGINNSESLVIGETLRINLQSPNLFVTINATCEVVYVGNDGYIGLKFVTIPMEAKSSIIEYVSKFST